MAMTSRLLGGFLLATLGTSRPALAQCTDPADTKALKKTLRLSARCNARMLKSASAVCAPVPPPPACAGTIATDALALAYGPNDPPAGSVDTRALKLQLKCQRRIG